MLYARARAAILSGAPLVMVEAAAGCGKTHEAANSAIALARDLPLGQEVLLLAHTNGAVHEFQSRVAQAGARVRARTLDSFASEIVSAYARPLGLPEGLGLGRDDGVPFSDLAPALLTLLRRAPSLAKAIANHYPVMLLDEHQDARHDQHDVIRMLCDSGSIRVRLFGDPLQAIYGGLGGDQLVDWDSLRQEADEFLRLGHPHRWSETPALGRWLGEVREALLSGAPIPLASRPDSVTVRRVTDLGPQPNLRNRRPVRSLIGPLSDALSEAEGRLGILTKTRYHAVGVRAATRRRVLVEEGHDLREAATALAAAKACEGDARELGLGVMRFFESVGFGLNAQRRKTIERALGDGGFVQGRRPSTEAFIAPLARLYESPLLSTWCRVVARIARALPNWLQVDLTQSVRAIVSVSEHEDPQEAFERHLAMRRAQARLPIRCAMTVHKSKGRDFDHVVLPSCCEHAFPDTLDGRRLLYVALTRARESIRILLPGAGVSPLFDA